MHTLRTTPKGMFIVATLLLTLLAPSAAEAAPPYEAQERQFLTLMNASRKDAGRAALKGSAEVAKVARNWSKRMAADGNLRHNPDVSSQLTVEWRAWGENVGFASNGSGGSLSSVVKRLHRAFMESDGHRANILGDFNKVGVGVAVAADDTMWATMVFVKGPGATQPDPSPGTPDTTGTPSGLTDIAGNPHRQAIVTAWRNNLIEPCEGRRFCPRRRVTRTEMANVVGRMLDVEPSAGDHFTDVTASTSMVNTLADAGVVTGCAPRRFCPSQPVTRAQLASLFVRALPDLEASSRGRFTDLPADYVHTGAINALADAGITEGCRSRRFCPTARVTRGQLASFVVRALDT